MCIHIANEPPERRTSIFHYYRKEKEIHPELCLSPKKHGGDPKKRPEHPYVPRGHYEDDQVEEDESTDLDLEGLLGEMNVTLERNTKLRSEMFLSNIVIPENILTISGEGFLEEQSEALRHSQNDCFRTSKALEAAEIYLGDLLNAKKKDKIDIAEGHKTYRDCKKEFFKAERRAKQLLKQQEEEKNSLWKFVLLLYKENKMMEEKIEEKLEEKRFREEEEALLRAELGEDEEESAEKEEEKADEAVPVEIQLQLEMKKMAELLEPFIITNADNMSSTLRMQHERGEMVLKINDRSSFALGMLIVIGDGDSIEVRTYEGEPEIMLDGPLLHTHMKESLVRVLPLTDGSGDPEGESEEKQEARQTIEAQQAIIDYMYMQVYGAPSDALAIEVEEEDEFDPYAIDKSLPRTPGANSPHSRPVSPNFKSLLNLSPIDFEEVLNTHEKTEQARLDRQERIRNFKVDITGKDIKVVIIGAGLAGLIAARDLAEEGFKVEILEASSRVGGRMYSTEFPGTDVVVDLGGEWIFPHKHQTVAKECERYGLELKQNSYDGKQERKRYIFQYDLNIIDTKDEYMIPVPQDEKAEFDRIMKKVSYDASVLTFEQGFDEPNIVLYDMSYFQYVTVYLGATKSVREFLLSIGYQFVQSDPKFYSAVNILKIVSSFELEEDVACGLCRAAEDAFFLKPYRLTAGAGALIDKIYQELTTIHKDFVTIRFNSAVSLIDFVPGRADAWQPEPHVIDEDRFNHFYITPEVS